MSKFPPIFLKFLEDIGSDIHYYEHKIPRYIRIRDTSKLAEIQQELDIKETWLKDFYSLDAEKKIASTHCLKNGWIYGMDISSGLAVVALELQKNEHVLDICCAPGTKLVMAGELVSEGSVTGVDLSKHRLHTCKSMVQRASLQRVRLFLEDGTTFDCSPPCRIGPNVIYDYRQPKKLKTDIFHATRLLRNNPLVLIEDHLYDKVMVDAECTHDGSIAHIDKYIKNGWDQFEENFMNPDRLENLETLQRKLLENGFRLLKPGAWSLFLVQIRFHNHEKSTISSTA
ncbi:S-adenosyl-L-methionine-dependent methyltransferase domain-containing protein [Gorgonomyces haynaldii]|nr:S-adenosyl-L-methionine-dependent methyltransferase domain-containing protein [Gorgonomyces haynaldii]